MRCYDTDNSEKFFISPYARYHLDSTGCIFEHSITGTVFGLAAERKQISLILRLLQSGVNRTDLEAAFEGVNGYSGEELFALLVKKGMIE